MSILFLNKLNMLFQSSLKTRFTFTKIGRVMVTQDLNSFREIIAHAQCSVNEKNLKYIPCVPHKNNCKKKLVHMTWKRQIPIATTIWSWWQQPLDSWVKHLHFVYIKVILHQFWVKNIFPWKFNLEYGGTFTKLFMHVASPKCSVIIFAYLSINVTIICNILPTFSVRYEANIEMCICYVGWWIRL
jgi:hypothetical protein